MSQTPDKLAKYATEATKNVQHPPLDKWHPELSGDMDLLVTHDGQWLHKGDPITREAIVRLFSTILRREEDGGYYLVTPVEKWRIRVEDAPLLAHSLAIEGEGESQIVSLTTNVGEVLEVGKEHPLEVGTYPGSEEPRPVIHVRNGLVARLVTAAYYDLTANMEEKSLHGQLFFGVFSKGDFYKIGPVV
ncbi:MAG TPA: DUF1285 domain-containing protein [Marinobacter sp.]|nr:DUF1285 domain-containing protein [Marinobacter sp.]